MFTSLAILRSTSVLGAERGYAGPFATSYRILQYQNSSKVLANSLILDVVALLQLRHLTRVPLHPPPSSPFSSLLVLVGIERRFFFLGFTVP